MSTDGREERKPAARPGDFSTKEGRKERRRDCETDRAETRHGEDEKPVPQIVEDRRLHLDAGGRLPARERIGRQESVGRTAVRARCRLQAQADEDDAVLEASGRQEAGRIEGLVVGIGRVAARRSEILDERAFGSLPRGRSCNSQRLGGKAVSHAGKTAQIPVAVEIDRCEAGRRACLGQGRDGSHAGRLGRVIHRRLGLVGGKHDVASQRGRKDPVGRLRRRFGEDDVETDGRGARFAQRPRQAGMERARPRPALPDLRESRLVDGDDDDARFGRAQREDGREKIEEPRLDEAEGLEEQEREEDQDDGRDDEEVRLSAGVPDVLGPGLDGLKVTWKLFHRRSKPRLDRRGDGAPLAGDKRSALGGGVEEVERRQFEEEAAVRRFP